MAEIVHSNLTATKGRNFVSSSMYIEELNIPRPICISQAGSIELHDLSDASKIGFALCFYVRFEHLDGSVSVRQITTKD